MGHNPVCGGTMEELFKYVKSVRVGHALNRQMLMAIKKGAEAVVALPTLLFVLFAMQWVVLTLGYIIIALLNQVAVAINSPEFTKFLATSVNTDHLFELQVTVVVLAITGIIAVPLIRLIQYLDQQLKLNPNLH